MDSEGAENPPKGDYPKNGKIEFQGIGSRPERADVLTPETFDEKASGKDQRQRGERHPEHDFPLETRCNGIIWVELLAEKLTRPHRHIKYDEEKAIFYKPQEGIGYASSLRGDGFYPKRFTELYKQVLNRSYRTDVSAKELAEKDDGKGEGQSHENLGRGHRAGQRPPHDIGRKGLQSAHRAEGLRVGRLSRVENLGGEAAEEKHEGKERSPLENDAWPVLSALGLRHG